MHQFGWISEREGELFKFASERGGYPESRGEGSLRKGGGGFQPFRKLWQNTYLFPGYIFKKQKEEPGMQILGKFNLVYSGHIVMKTLNTLHSII